MGCHIDAGADDPFRFEFHNGRLLATPGSGGQSLTGAARQFAACIESNGHRVVLSGIGGDEVMGGVPSPTPELMDLLARARFRTLARQLKVWALNKRKPWFHLFFEAARGFFPPSLVGTSKQRRPASWLHHTFVKRQRVALTGYPSRIKLLGPLPSVQQNAFTVDSLRRQLACSVLPAKPVYEKRYPYLDRSMLEFMQAIPRDQVVRPGQRRSLMRRALTGMVPDELLNRKRKAFVSRAPIAAILADWPDLVEMAQQMICSSLGIVDERAFSEAMQSIQHGQEFPVVTVMRTLAIESWLRSVKVHLLRIEPPDPSGRLPETTLAERQP